MSLALTLQKDIADFLDAHSEFTYVPIIREFADVEAGDALLDDYVDQHLRGDIPKAGKFGLCCIVSTPASTLTAPNAPGPVQDLVCIVQVVENIANNMSSTVGTQIRADSLAETIARLLHLWSHDGTHELVVTESVQDRELEGTLRGWLVTVRSAANALNAYTAAAEPVLSIADDTLTITEATSGASVYYTTDGSFPNASNGTLYESPVDVAELPAGTLIRAAAFKTGLRGSGVAQVKV